ncbi:GPI anchored serine-threonine rich protein [Diaporthe sp. PMI_573]|nr:GPI anchored serine-threonine rich protein [Diaporthaceae sp. PMI_573]
MHFSLYAATCLALVGRAFAQTEGFDAITAPTRDQTLTAGTTSTVTWDYNPQYEGTVTITLLQGATPETLQVGSAIATGIDNSAGSYSWSIDSSLGADATYGLRISLDSNPATFQYSFPFHIASSGAGSTSSSISSSVTVSTSSSVSSASVSSTSVSSSISASLSSTVSPTSAPTTFPTLTPTSGGGVNSTKTATGTTLTSKVTATGTGSGTPSSSSSGVATAGAAKVVAGSFAAMGGLAAALFAL